MIKEVGLVAPLLSNKKQTQKPVAHAQRAPQAFGFYIHPPT